jgi:hypothetical protein
MPPQPFVICMRSTSCSLISLLAKGAAPPPSDAEQRRMRVLTQFSTIVYSGPCD